MDLTGIDPADFALWTITAVAGGSAALVDFDGDSDGINEIRFDGYAPGQVIDAWFDSGAMPFAQWHYPFENKKAFERNFPGDFIAEGVDQTRGWFYTLHAIATLVMDDVAYRNVVVNGLVLDENGEKMSKSKGNSVDPFEVIDASSIVFA